MKIRVYYEDTDAGGIVYYANYLKFIERGRTEFLRNLGISQSEIYKNLNIKFIVHSLSVDYMNPSYLDDQLTVETSIKNIKKASIEFSQNIFKSQDGKTIDIIKSKCIIVPINDESKIKPIPSIILNKIQES
jgi:acyl-CoA thioester hydrolase